MVEQNMSDKPGGVLRGVMLKPEPIERECRVVSPLEHPNLFHRYPIQPQREFTVGGGHRIVHLGHDLDAGPPVARERDGWVLDQMVAPVAGRSSLHPHPIGVKIDAILGIHRLDCDGKAVISPW